MDDSDDESGTILWWRLEIAVASTAYPSELQVSGIGPVTDVDVSLLGFDTQYATDINFLLVGPRGQQALLLDDAGGGTAEAVTGRNLRFDDEAPFQAPEEDRLESTTYQPTSYEDDPDFPPPAPAAPGPQGRLRRPWVSSTAPTPTGPGDSSASTRRARTSPRSTAGRCTSSGTTPPPPRAPSRWRAAPPGRETSPSRST